MYTNLHHNFLAKRFCFSFNNENISDKRYSHTWLHNIIYLFIFISKILLKHLCVCVCVAWLARTKIIYYCHADNILHMYRKYTQQCLMHIFFKDYRARDFFIFGIGIFTQQKNKRISMKEKRFSHIIVWVKLSRIMSLHTLYQAPLNIYKIVYYRNFWINILWISVKVSTKYQIKLTKLHSPPFLPNDVYQKYQASIFSN